MDNETLIQEAGELDNKYEHNEDGDPIIPDEEAERVGDQMREDNN